MSTSAVHATSLRQYRLRSVLGRGYFSTIYQADLRAAGRFSRVVALKIARDGAAASLARLREEARLLGLLRHRAIVSAQGLITVAGYAALALEYVPGADLDRLLEVGPTPIPAALEIVEELACALDAAWHQPDAAGQTLRAVHGDLQARRVRLTRYGAVKLLGFGHRPSQRPAVPEGRVGREGDVYALGALLAQLLTGVAFPAPTSREAHGRHLTELGRGLTALGLGPAGVALVQGALAWEPAARPAARELARRCTALRAGQTGLALREWADRAVPPFLSGAGVTDDPLVGRTLKEGVAPPPPLPPGQDPSGEWRVRPWAALLIGAAAMGIAGLAVWAGWALAGALHAARSGALG